MNRLLLLMVTVLVSFSYDSLCSMEETQTVFGKKITDPLHLQFNKLKADVRCGKSKLIKDLINGLCPDEKKELWFFISKRNYSCPRIKPEKFYDYIKQRVQSIYAIGKKEEDNTCFSYRLEHLLRICSTNLLLLLLSTNEWIAQSILYSLYSAKRTTALHIACACEDLEKVKLFVWAGANKTEKNYDLALPDDVILNKYLEFCGVYGDDHERMRNLDKIYLFLRGKKIEHKLKRQNNG